MLRNIVILAVLASVFVFKIVTGDEPPVNYTLNDHFEGDTLRPYWSVEGPPPKVANSWVFMEPPGAYSIWAPDKKQGYGIWEFYIKPEGEETGDVWVRLIDNQHNVQNAISLSISTISRASFTAVVMGNGKITEKVIGPCVKDKEYKLKVVYLFDKVEFFINDELKWTCTENIPAVELFVHILPHAMRVDYVKAWRQ